MRIIAGTFKGKKILDPMDIATRPLKDLTKESIFNIINHSNKFEINLEGSNILDLFSGVGSFGIECLSRGVKNVVFIENYNGVLPILKKNLINLKLSNNYNIIEQDIYDKNLFFKFDNKFDIIFLDPPYKNKNLENLLINIKNAKILDKNGIIIVHRHKNEKDIIPKNYEIIEQKKYGISKIIFLTILN
jgi:16S rRNA (guanine966-N2)-methyltransferase